MAKFTLIGDPHAKPDNLDKINTLFDIIEDFPDDVILTGDLLDTKELMRGKCLNVYLRRIKASRHSFIVLVGNHDWFNLECKEHSLEALKNLPNVVVVDKPWHYSDYLLFLPYFSDKNLLKEALKDARGKNVVCHADIKSFDYGNGFLSEDGLEISDLSKCKTIISGHYHKYQKKGNITYIGTPFSQSFGESNQKKYIGTLDEHSGEIELLETPFPSHRTYEVDCDKTLSFTNYTAADYNRVVLTGSQENINLFKRAEGIKYIEKPSTSLKKSLILETQSTDNQFSTWAVSKGYSKELVNLGLEILRDV